jgi:hypothetical protein
MIDFGHGDGRSVRMPKRIYLGLYFGGEVREITPKFNPDVLPISNALGAVFLRYRLTETNYLVFGREIA